MITVHMIGSAHLDPVWLWQKAAGVDAVLATARSACDRIDEYASFIFTCSGSWFHRRIETLDTLLFERVCRFVRAGRWQLVGGMVIEPDCNLPSAASFTRQLEVGQRYTRSRFDQAVTVGYNVDSFGHGAYLPRFLRRADMDAYVFMRPGPHEKALPANLFTWQSPDGCEVATFRIASSYATYAADIREHIEQAIIGLPDGIDQTMCFFGVGNHGGGPTKAQIEWIIEHANAIDGVRLVFSHPRAFFDAVASRAGCLPVVCDELQHSAIGCYSVERRIKVAMWRAEARLQQAQQTIDILPYHASNDDLEAVARAWHPVLFNQFHDILGGTCIDQASCLAAGQLFAAEAQADEIITAVTRRAFRHSARPGKHELIVLNPSDKPFDGLMEHESWFDSPQKGRVMLTDDQGRLVPVQETEPLAMAPWPRRLVFQLAVPARGRRLLRLAERTPSEAARAAPDRRALDARAGHTVHVKSHPDCIRLGNWIMRLQVLEDQTDTWSHSEHNRFSGMKVGEFAGSAAEEIVESGPLVTTARLGYRFGQSRVWWRLMFVADEPMLRVRLAIVWAEAHRLLRLRLESPSPIVQRTDLVSGGALARPIDGLEYPLGGAVMAGGERGSLAVVAPEIFSGSVDPQGINLTLLRSPYVAHHDPVPADSRSYQPVTDQGTHEFDLRIRLDYDGDMDGVQRVASQMLMPPVIWDMTG